MSHFGGHFLQKDVLLFVSLPTYTPQSMSIFFNQYKKVRQAKMFYFIGSPYFLIVTVVSAYIPKTHPYIVKMCL